MIDDGDAEHVSVLYGAPHQTMVLHAISTVGYRDCTGLRKGTGGGKLFAFHPDGDAAGGKDVHDSLASDGVFYML